MNYFKPSDLKQVDATVNYVTKAGSAFAIMPNDDQLFVPVRLVQQHNLEVGDAVRAWVVDNYTTGDSKHYATRWRTVTLTVVSRISDMVSAAPNPTPTPVPPTPEVEVEADPEVMEEIADDSDDVGLSPMGKAVAKRLREDRTWSVCDMLADIVKVGDAPIPPNFNAKLTNYLLSLHKSGQAACVRVYARGTQKSASAVYFAKNAEVFYDHLETPIEEEV